MADIFARPELQGGLPPELNRDLFASLDRALSRQEGRKFDEIQNEFNSRGMLQSGQNVKAVSEQVIGPGQERRAQYMGGLVRDSALLGREERMGAENFDRQKELQKIQFDNRLREIQEAAEVRKQLMMLQDELSSAGIGDFVGGVLGAGLGTMAGSAFGPIGAAIGNKIGGKLFGEGKNTGTPSWQGSNYSTNWTPKNSSSQGSVFGSTWDSRNDYSFGG